MSADAPDDRVLQSLALGFDWSVEEILLTLLSGAALVLRDDALSDPQRMRAALASRGVTVAGVSTAFWHQWARHPDAVRPAPGDRLRIVTSGGEAMQPDALRAWLAAGPGAVQLFNGYGPTEATITTCMYAIPADLTPDTVPDRIPVGRVLDGRAMYVLDAHGAPTPLGVPGELYVGGEGLARGYLARPELTAAAFVPDPFAGAPGARMNRTGDRARWRGDGNLEFLGRVDDQAKIRGFRIEPGEVEAALLAHPAVRGGVVVVREDAPGDKRLVAYVIGDASVASLREHLKRALPEYTIPSAFVALAALPLTPNGKVDRKALAPPARDAATDAPFVVPRTPIESVIARVWSEVLRRERVGAHDNFFDLGGHSLLATQVVTRLRRELDRELPLRALFEAPTVAGLAARVAAAAVADAPPLARAARVGSMPLSFAQQRLWFLEQLDPGNASYNMPVGVRLSGALDVAALDRTLNEIVRRHESLRTSVVTAGGRGDPGDRRVAPARAAARRPERAPGGGRPRVRARGLRGAAHRRARRRASRGIAGRARRSSPRSRPWRSRRRSRTSRTSAPVGPGPTPTTRRAAGASSGSARCSGRRCCYDSSGWCS